MKFHHIGIACKDISKEIKSISKIHDIIEISPIVHDTEQDAKLCMVKTSEGVNIEFISGPQVENLIKKRISYYHMCFEVCDIEKEILRLQSLGAFLVSDLKPAILFNNKRVAFLSVSYGIIELVES